MDYDMSNIEREIYFLVAKFLEHGPCQQAATALREEIHSNKILPKRTDWVGSNHARVLDEMKTLNNHLSDTYLVELLSRIGSLVEKAVPTNISCTNSILTAGRFSLLRNTPDYIRPRNTSTETTCYHGSPCLPAANSRFSNIAKTTYARSLAGTSCKRNVGYACNIYSKFSMHKRILGHLASVYCVSFDKTGHIIATGADDNLVKLWSTFDGRLVATFRGHSGEISDLAINQENTLIAAGSCDKTIRVWNLHTSSPIAVLQGHTGMITSIEFCPSAHEDARCLMSTGGDGTVCFWKWNIRTNVFDTTPVKFNEKSRPGAQMLCSSFSPGGGFLVTGSSDNIIRVYQMMPAPPERIAELSAHCDHVDSIQFSHAGYRFASGSRDGSAMIWNFQRNEWRHIALNAHQQLNKSPSIIDEESANALKLKVTMVGWNLNDQFLVTAVTDHTLKVWDSFTGDLVHVMVGHTDEMFVLECHPQEPYIFLSAGHDGNVILWDLLKGTMIKSFFNLLEGQGHGAIFDSRFAPDGMRFAASDSHGHICIFGLGSDDPYRKVPYEQFFHTDYRPLIRDVNNYVLDEQTQMAPHLMPPPFLVDVDGNPHPAEYQLLIPGRNANNLPMRRVEIPLSDLPPLLAEIAAEEAAAAGGSNMLSPERRRRSAHSPLRSPGGGGGGGVGLRQSGDVEGVRQVHSNVFITQDVSDAERAAWRNRKIIAEERECIKMQNELYRMEQGKDEIQRYLKEKKRRPPSTSQRAPKTSHQDMNMKTPKKRAKGGHRAAPRPRISYTVPSEMIPNQVDEEDEFIDVEHFFNSASDSDWNSDSSDSSDDSDWAADIRVKEQREARRRRLRRCISSGEEDAENEEEEEESEDDNDNDVNMEKGNDDDIIFEEQEPQTSTIEKEKKEAKGKKKKPRKGGNKALSSEDKEEDFSAYQPPEWITGMHPSKSPYVPQIGDEVYYFRQGHELYVNAVMETNLYEINPKKQCYGKYDLKAEELCRVVKFCYYPGHPIVCSVNLAIISPESGANTGGTFSVKYHDMPNVVDFFVLRQHYDQALQNDWKPGDRFRCDIEDQWWSGTIIKKEPFQEEFPASHFHSLVVRWDTGEEERLSPWDMEQMARSDRDVPVHEDDSDGSAASIVNNPVTDEDRALSDYIPLPSDWPDEGREEATERIANGIEQFSELPIAGAFAFPVDVETYPDYWSVVPYPTDLNSIRQRLVNKFYRRRNALLWEIRLIELNTKSYNEEDSKISNDSSIVVKVLVSFILDPERRDLIAFYNETVENGGFNNEERNENDSENGKKTSGKSKSSKKKKKKRVEASAEENEESAVAGSSTAQSWSSVASELLNFLISREDSDPFRQPVDTDRYPDYTSIVKDPMDFSIIRQQLDNNMYADLDSFVRDVRLVFSNSRLYNTNQRSRIYGMTLRLSALFEAKVQTVLSISAERQTRRKNSIRRQDENSQAVENCDARHWNNCSISNRRTGNASEQSGSSLRLVLRRNDGASVDAESSRGMSSRVSTRGESSNHGVSSVSASSNHSLGGDHSPRRTGIAINLRTGRARDLSEESSFQTDSDREAVTPSSSNTKQAPVSSQTANALTVKRKRTRRVNMPRFMRQDIRRTTFERTDASYHNGDNEARPKRNVTRTRTSDTTFGNYQTRSGRKCNSKFTNVMQDSEKENLGFENGIERRTRRRKSKIENTEEDLELNESEAERDTDDYDDDEDVYANGQDSEDDEETAASIKIDTNSSSEEDVDENSCTSETEDLPSKATRTRTRSKTRNEMKRQQNNLDSQSTKRSSRKRPLPLDMMQSTSRKSRRTRLKVNYNENIEDYGSSESKELPVDNEASFETEAGSDNEDSTNFIGVSSRGRLRKAASRYADYVDS